jgi:methylthioribose-1-phosphate isomerase
MSRQAAAVSFGSSIETRSPPSSLAATHRGFTFYVAAPTSSIETRSLPSSLAATHRGFTFYVAAPTSSIVPLNFGGASSTPKFSE